MIQKLAFNLPKSCKRTVSSTSHDDTASISTFGASVCRDRNPGHSVGRQHRRRHRSGKQSIAVLAAIIVIFGLIAGIVFSTIFWHAENISRRNEFESGASITVAKISDSFDEYADVASLIHGRCRHRPRFNASAFESDPEGYTERYNEWSESFRRDFRELYEYINASGLKFKAMQFDPNITNLERPLAEDEAETFYIEHYPGVNYTGFRGFNGDSKTLLPRWRNQSFYFPIHYMEPIQGNEAAIDLDYYSSETRIRAVEALFSTERPSLTDRLSLVKQKGQVSRCSTGNDLLSSYTGPSYGVVLMHPGVRLSQDDETSWPRDFSSIVLCISDLMKRAALHQDKKVSVHIHDLSDPTKSEPEFMGAARLNYNDTNGHENQGASSFKLIEEVDLHELDCDNDVSCYQKTISIANRKWTVTVMNEEGLDRVQVIIVVFIGLLIFLAFVALAVWVVANDRRNRTYSTLKSRAAAERNALVLENANKAAQTERELNDFLAHEVRNPLSAAMAATQFLRTELNRRNKSYRGIDEDLDDGESENENISSNNKNDSIDGDPQGDGFERRTSKLMSSLSELILDPSSDEDGIGPVEAEHSGFMESITELRDSSIKSLSSPRLLQAREDIQVVDHALHFINDLLRNMLDMNRAASKKLKVKLAPADLLQDILEPIAGMLHRGGENIGGGNGESKVQIIVDCPENMTVETDILRLKQVILNLSRNSVKFINEGFIRLRAEVVELNDSDDDWSLSSHDTYSKTFDIEANHYGSSRFFKSTVRIYVEDSGSGIPIEKQENLFNKYQESLDLLSQGTGIGLHLCKTLVELMGGEISLDTTYDSGVPGNPGARFVIDLKSSPVSVSSNNFGIDENGRQMLGLDAVGQGERNASENIEGTFSNEEKEDVPSALQPELPKSLKVLFVDDDRILRKLFTRTIKTVAPDWVIREAANGETAILLAKEEHFDLIFCDMYMASVEKQLLGTETVAEMRANGIKSRICGLSANDKEMEFLEAGSDAFLFKPMPCDATAVRKTLHNVLYGEHERRIS